MNSINLSSPELSPIIWKHVIDNTGIELSQKIDDLLKHYKNLESYVSKMDFQTGSVSILSGITLYMLTKYFQPKKVFEVGTFIGRSTVSMALGISQYCDNGTIYTCDKDNDFYLNELKLGCEIQGMGKTLSTDALRKVCEKEDRIDLFYFDGRLQESDLQYVAQLSGEDTIIIVDDFEGIEKGVINCALLKNCSPFRSYFLVYPCPKGFLDFLNSYGSRSMTALLVPPTIFRLTPQ